MFLTYTNGEGYEHYQYLINELSLIIFEGIFGKISIILSGGAWHFIQNNKASALSFVNHFLS
ncbi:hypothetical protein Bateq7PJ16_3894 [Bacillus subtilis]|nr:hypothetical protein ABP1_0678 [Bacillus subtilis]QHF59700.1 hypothetical protein Bateq7PJ16_3894 [Bacillus subtilis]RPK04187.1 hypothetical protein EH11_00591 [Bacillus subtilis]RUS09859.1 hypothetical protein EFW59_00590 [Bacillus subtilis]